MVSESLFERIELGRSKYGQNRSEVVRNALIEYFDKRGDDNAKRLV
jgi:hypothetical protein